jgi:hypothetical protein
MSNTQINSKYITSESKGTKLLKEELQMLNFLTENKKDILKNKLSDKIDQILDITVKEKIKLAIKSIDSEIKF